MTVMHPIFESRRSCLKLFASLAGTSAMGASVSPSCRAQGPGEAGRSVISIFLEGGFSHVDSFDPKPGSTADQPFGAIQTRTPGVAFSDRFPLLADRSNRLTVIRSMTHGENDHVPSQRYWRTGRADAGSQDPSLGAIVAHRTGWRIPPAYVSIPAGPPDAGFLGASCVAYTPDGDQPVRNVTTSESDTRRQRFSDVIRHRSTATDPSESANGLAEARRRAESIAQSPLMRGLADVSGESASVLRGYGIGDGPSGLPWGLHLLMARRLAAAGSRFVRVELGGWDHHVGLADSFAARSAVLDRALAGLIDDLDTHGLSERVLVMVSTEFGRTPRMVGGGQSPGRDHFGSAYSGLLAGGGNRPATIGRTDASGSSVADDPVTPSDWWMTACRWTGLDPERPDFLPENRKLNVSGRALVSWS